MSMPLFTLIAAAPDQKSPEGADRGGARSQVGRTHSAQAVFAGAGALLQFLIVIAMFGGCLQALISVADQVDLQRLPVELVSRYR